MNKFKTVRKFMIQKHTHISPYIIIIIPVVISCLANFISVKTEAAQINQDELPDLHIKKQVNVFNDFPLLISQGKRNNYQLNRINSITEVRDVTKKDDYYLALKTLIEEYQVVRLYSDGSFRGKQEITGYEAIDLIGGVLKSMSDKMQKICGFAKPKLPEVKIPKDINQNAFYYDSYIEIAKFSPAKQRFYGNEDSLTRAGFVVMVTRYLLDPFNYFIAQSLELIKTKELISKIPSTPKSTQSSLLSQITSVSEMSDVQPTDFFFQDLQALERYGCIAGYPDGTFRPNKKISRGDFIVFLDFCVRSLEVATTTAIVESSSCANNLHKNIAKRKFLPQVINKESNSTNF